MTYSLESGARVLKFGAIGDTLQEQLTGAALTKCNYGAYIIMTFQEFTPANSRGEPNAYLQHVVNAVSQVVPYLKSTAC